MGSKKKGQKKKQRFTSGKPIAKKSTSAGSTTDDVVSALRQSKDESASKKVPLEMRVLLRRVQDALKGVGSSAYNFYLSLAMSCISAPFCQEDGFFEQFFHVLFSGAADLESPFMFLTTLLSILLAKEFSIDVLKGMLSQEDELLQNIDPLKKDLTIEEAENYYEKTHAVLMKYFSPVMANSSLLGSYFIESSWGILPKFLHRFLRDYFGFMTLLQGVQFVGTHTQKWLKKFWHSVTGGSSAEELRLVLNQIIPETLSEMEWKAVKTDGLMESLFLSFFRNLLSLSPMDNPSVFELKMNSDGPGSILHQYRLLLFGQLLEQYLPIRVFVADENKIIVMANAELVRLNPEAAKKIKGQLDHYLGHVDIYYDCLQSLQKLITKAIQNSTFRVLEKAIKVAFEFHQDPEASNNPILLLRLHAKKQNQPLLSCVYDLVQQVIPAEFIRNQGHDVLVMFQFYREMDELASVIRQQTRDLCRSGTKTNAFYKETFFTALEPMVSPSVKKKEAVQKEEIAISTPDRLATRNIFKFKLPKWALFFPASRDEKSDIDEADREKVCYLIDEHGRDYGPYEEVPAGDYFRNRVFVRLLLGEEAFNSTEAYHACLSAIKKGFVSSGLQKVSEGTFFCKTHSLGKYSGIRAYGALVAKRNGALFIDINSHTPDHDSTPVYGERADSESLLYPDDARIKGIKVEDMKSKSSRCCSAGPEQR